jgi:hypothetical protein
MKMASRRVLARLESATDQTETLPAELTRLAGRRRIRLLTVLRVSGLSIFPALAPKNASIAYPKFLALLALLVPCTAARA